MKSFPEIPNWQAGTNSEYITHRNLSIPGFDNLNCFGIDITAKVLLLTLVPRVHWGRSWLDSLANSLSRHPILKGLFQVESEIGLYYDGQFQMLLLVEH